MSRKIFEAVTFHNLSMKNRLIRSATWEGIANFDGSITDEAYDIYRELAHGGVGAVIVGFTDVSDDDHYIHGAMRLSRDDLIPSHRKLTGIIHEGGCPAISQLALGAYYRKLPNGLVEQAEPDNMTEDEIRQVIAMFIQSAKRAEQAGFDGVQIHAAHFFFLSRFISPRANHRTDSYGGNTLKRSRILTEILDGIKLECPNLHVTVKINSSDFIRGGLRSIRVMQTILDTTKIELLSLSRPLLREPDLPAKFLSGKSSESLCVSCNACYSSHAHRCIYR